MFDSKCQKSDSSERISGRTIFKCVEEPSLMGVCEQRRTEFPLDHYTISIKQHRMWESVSDVRYYTLVPLLAADPVLVKVELSTR